MNGSATRFVKLRKSKFHIAIKKLFQLSHTFSNVTLYYLHFSAHDVSSTPTYAAARSASAQAPAVQQQSPGNHVSLLPTLLQPELSVQTSKGRCRACCVVNHVLMTYGANNVLCLHIRHGDIFYQTMRACFSLRVIKSSYKRVF